MSKTKKQLIALVGTIILAVLLVFVIKGILDSQNDRHPIYVYTQNIKEGTKITKDMIGPITMERETLMQPDLHLQDNYVNSPNMVIGKVSSRQMYVGEPVLLKGLADWVEDSENVASGDSRKRAYTLEVTSKKLFSGDIKAGDKVDILEVGTGSSDNSSFLYSIPVLQNVVIQDIYTPTNFKYESKADLTASEATANGGGQGANEIGAITVHLTLEDINKLNTTMQRGELAFAKYLGSSEEYSSLGYVIGNYSKEFNGNANPRVNIIEDQSESEQIKTEAAPTESESNGGEDTIIDMQR